MHGKKTKIRTLLAAGITALLLLMASCQSTEEPAAEVKPPVEVPLSDGGFQNLGSSRALTPEEWARLMGYVDVTDNAVSGEIAETAAIETPPQDEPFTLEASEPVLEEETTENISEDNDEVLSYEAPAETEESGLPEGTRIIPEAENGTRLIEESTVTDMGYEEGDVHLAGEEGIPKIQNTDMEGNMESISDGGIRLIEDSQAADDGDGMDPGIINEIASASAYNRPGEATILTFIQEHYSLIFLAAFALLAVSIFISMTRYASTGNEEEAKMVLRKRKILKAQEEIRKEQMEEDMRLSPVPGKSLVFDDDDGPSMNAGNDDYGQRMPDSGLYDELALEPADDIPGYDETISGT